MSCYNISHIVEREGKFGPFYIVNFTDATSCIVAKKSVIDVNAKTLDTFAKRGTNVKFNDGHKECVGSVSTPILPPSSVDSSLLPVLERIANALETLAQNSVYNQME